MNAMNGKAGRVIEIPVDVHKGDRLWEVEWVAGRATIYDEIVSNVAEDGVFVPDWINGGMYLLDWCRFGKTVFLSELEAIDAAERMGYNE